MNKEEFIRTEVSPCSCGNEVSTYVDYMRAQPWKEAWEMPIIHCSACRKNTGFLEANQFQECLDAWERIII